MLKVRFDISLFRIRVFKNNITFISQSQYIEVDSARMKTKLYADFQRRAVNLILMIFYLFHLMLHIIIIPS